MCHDILRGGAFTGRGKSCRSGPKDQSHADLSPIFEEKFPETRCMRDIPLKKRIVLLNGHGTSSF